MNRPLHSRIYSVLTRSASLTASIYIAAAATLLCVAGFLTYTLRAQRQLASITHEILDRRIATMYSAQNTKLSLVSFDAALFHYLATHDASQLSEAEALRDATRVEIQRLRDLSDSAVVQTRLAILSDQSEGYFADAQEVLSVAANERLTAHASTKEAAAWARSQVTRGNALELASAEGRAKLIRVFALCNELITWNRIELEHAHREMNQVLQRGRETALSIGGATGAVVLLLAIGLAIRLLGPMRALLDGVERVQSGDLEVQIPVYTNDEVGMLTSAFNRMTHQVRETQQKLVQETITDDLTGVFNARHFRRLLRQELERARRSDLYLSLLMIDIDHFKTFNDTLGHEVGNQILKAVCQLIQEQLRDIDALARYGGDELAVILPDTSPEEAKELAHRLHEAAINTHFPGAERVPAGRLTISIGGASYPEEAKSASQLVTKADQALYSAKEKGRNQVCWTSNPYVERKELA